MKTQDLNSLAKKCQQGDAVALRLLVSTLHPRVEGHVRAVLRRYGLQHLYEGHLQDMVNYVWKDLLENLDKFDQGDFELWFAFRRVRRILDYLRKEQRRMNREQAAHPECEPRDPHPPPSPWDKMFMDQVEERLSLLPKKQALVLKLYYWDDLNYRQIADLLGIRVNAVGTLHTRGMKKLRKLLQQGRKVK